MVECAQIQFADSLAGFSLQHGACVNAMDLWQFTPLHEAASKNRVEVCSLLLSHGADPTLLNCHSKSAVDMAPTPELKERLTCESGTHTFHQSESKPHN